MIIIVTFKTKVVFFKDTFSFYYLRFNNYKMQDGGFKTLLFYSNGVV